MLRLIRRGIIPAEPLTIILAGAIGVADP